MKKIILMVTLLIGTILLASNVFAADSKVTWTDYKSYRDINEGNSGRKQLRESTFNIFEKHFSKLAAHLSENQTLKIDVTDVDLAGDTHVAGISRTRIIKDIYPYHLKMLVSGKLSRS